MPLGIAAVTAAIFSLFLAKTISFLAKTSLKASFNTPKDSPLSMLNTEAP
ncbi:MAG: hypothetical protein ABIH08_06120 [Candidatus Omnitrophota bacterium]